MPVHALSQQTESTHEPDAHCEPVVHPDPRGSAAGAVSGVGGVTVGPSFFGGGVFEGAASSFSSGWSGGAAAGAALPEQA